jgi:hypothetical protein
MATFRASIPYTYSVDFEIKAEDHNEAKRVIMTYLSGTLPYSLQYLVQRLDPECDRGDPLMDTSEWYIAKEPE